MKTKKENKIPKIRIPRKIKKELKKMNKFFIFPSEKEIKKMNDDFLKLFEENKSIPFGKFTEIFSK